MGIGRNTKRVLQRPQRSRAMKKAFSQDEGKLRESVAMKGTVQSGRNATLLWTTKTASMGVFISCLHDANCSALLNGT